MRRLALVVVSLIALVVVATAAARDPRKEQERLRSADMNAARGALLTLRDLQTGFKREAQSSDQSHFSCPGYNPDFSRFVITGKAHANYEHPAGAWVTTAVEIYASRAHAAGDFRAGAKPGLAACLAHTLKQAGALGGQGQVQVTILRSRMLPAPRIGERTARYEAVARFKGPAATITVYLDMLAFQKGRALGAFAAMSVSQPIRDGASLARLMLARM